MRKSFEEHLAAAGTVRQVDGSNQYSRRNNSCLWYWNHAESFRASALVLWWAHRAEDRTLTGEALGLGEGHQLSASLPRVFALLCGQSIELLLKATEKALNLRVTSIHRLNELRENVGIDVDEHQSVMLDALTEYIYWHGRYPAPKEDKNKEKTEESWEESAEKLRKLTNSEGALSNYYIREREINRENYDALWGHLAPYFWTAHEKVSESVE